MESVTFKVKDRDALQAALEKLCLFLAKHEIGQERIFDCKLVACELVGNVLKYTKGEAGLHIELTEGLVVLKALSDSFFKLPETIVCSDVMAENGRGLFLVHTLSEGRVTAEENGIVATLKV